LAPAAGVVSIPHLPPVSAFASAAGQTGSQPASASAPAGGSRPVWRTAQG
jgi:hypothetical protein